MAESSEITPELLAERLLDAERLGKSMRLQPAAVRVLSGVLRRAINLRDEPESLDREADAARFILTGSWVDETAEPTAE